MRTRPNPPHRRQIRQRHPRFAFTILEVLVVVAVIGIIGAIVINYAQGAYNKTAKITRTRAALKTLAAIATNYEIKTGGKAVNHFNASYFKSSSTNQSRVTQFDWSDGRKSNTVPPAWGGTQTTLGSDTTTGRWYTGCRFVYATYQVPELKTLYSSLGNDVFKDGFDPNIGYLGLFDAWGTEILYFSHVSTDSTNEDDYTRDDPFPARDRAYFVSAGPDKQFGDVRSTASAADKKASEDNIYSYQME